MKMHIPKAKKAAAESQAAASRHNQLTRPSDLVRAKMIVELSERCQNSPLQNLVRSGFSPERAFAILIAYLNAVSTRKGPRWVGAALAARLIGVTRSQVLEMAKTGEVRTFHFRHGYRFHDRDLLDWIVSHPADPTEAKLSGPSDSDRPCKPNRSA
jgi:hypothetical protein